MKTCGDGCTRICDSCKHYQNDFSGFGKCGHAEHPKKNVCFIDHCEDFHCKRSIEEFI